MEHCEYRRIHPDADTAILFIHGILGTPNHFAPFIPLIPESVSVYNLLLDGHGKGTLDFSHSSMRKWETLVEDSVRLLASSHKEIYIAAHSMGTLLAIEQALTTPKVAGLFLIAVPIIPFPKLRMFITAARLYLGKFSPDDKYMAAARHACSISLSKNPLHYLGWIPRYMELFAKIRRTRRLLSHLAIPCTAYQSQNDEMVSARSIPYLQKHSRMAVYTLASSGHYYYSPDDMEFLKKAFLQFARKNRPGN